jgi:hypothetical protein
MTTKKRMPIAGIPKRLSDLAYELVDQYNASGRVAFVYPKLGTIALNGFPSIPAVEAMQKMKSRLDVDGKV